MRPALLLVALLITPSHAADAPAEKLPADFAPYVESIPKFFIKIDFLPIRGGRVTLAPATPNDPPREYVVKDFWMARCEITWDAFDVYRRSEDLNPQERQADNMRRSELRSRPSKPHDNPDRGFGHSGYAANSINFPSAVAYAEFLSKHTGRTYRLPTEAEFEYAARAGRPGQPNAAELFVAARHKENAVDVNLGPDDLAPHPAGALAPNPWGLHDMLGNLAEWTLPLDPKSPPAARGGSYRTAATKLTYHFRQSFNPRWQDRDPGDPKSIWWLSDGEFIGFRLVRERTGSK